MLTSANQSSPRIIKTGGLTRAYQDLPRLATISIDLLWPTSENQGSPRIIKTKSDSPGLPIAIIELN